MARGVHVPAPPATIVTVTSAQRAQAQSACLVNVHAKSTLDPGATTRTPGRTEGPGPRHLPGQTRAIPRTARAVTGNFHDPKIRAMILTIQAMNDRARHADSPTHQPAQAGGTVSAVAPNIQGCASKLPIGIQPISVHIGGVALAFWMSPLIGGMGLLAARRAIRALRWSAHRVLLNAAGTAARIRRPGSGRDGDRGPDHHRDGGGERKPIA